MASLRVDLPAPKKDPLLDPRKMRRILAEDPEWNVPSVPSLVDLCLQHLVNNFEKNPLLDKIPERYRQTAIDKLATTLPLAITAGLLNDDNYWKRSYETKWGLDSAPSRTRPWKRQFFERNVQEIIQEFSPGSSSNSALQAILGFCGSLVEELEIKQLLPPQDKSPEVPDQPGDGPDEPIDETDTPQHVDFDEVLRKLPNLKTLSLTYVVRDCGMNFKWSLFGMTRGDAFSLGAALQSFPALESLTIHSSLVDDTRVRILMSRLLGHPGLKHLDLSHNAIGDKGARAIAKFLHSSTVITSISLCDNQIRHAGARAIAASARDHCSLTAINLRLNRLDDAGGRALFEGLLGPSKLTALNVASNGLGKSSAAALCHFLQKQAHLTHLELACNELGEDSGRLLLSALDGNRSICSMDVRLCQFNSDTEIDLNKLLQRNLKLGAGK